MSATVWEEHLLMHVNNNLNYMLQHSSNYSQNSAKPPLDYAKIYANMKEFNESQGVLVALGRAIQLWRFMSTHDELYNSCSSNEGDVHNNLLEQVPLAPNWNFIVSPYIATPEHLAPMRPLLSQKSRQNNFSQKSIKNKQRQNLFSMRHNELKSTGFKNESNVIYKLFKALHLLYNFIEDKLPMPHEESDLENPECFMPTMNIESMLFGKLFAGPQPATFCLQTLVRRMHFKVKTFLGNMQLITNKFKLKDRNLYMECDEILNKLQFSIDQLYLYTEIRFNFKDGVFLSSHLYSFAESLLQVLENLMELARESNFYVHLINWEMAHREKKSGAFYTKAKQDFILSEFLKQENDTEIMNTLFNYSAASQIEEEEGSIVVDEHEIPAISTEEEIESNTILNLSQFPENELNCFDKKGFYETTASTALFNSTRRHAA